MKLQACNRLETSDGEANEAKAAVVGYDRWLF